MNSHNLTPSEIALFRSVKKSALVLLLLYRLQAPVTARLVSEILEIDYSTSRKRLAELSRLGFVARSSAGWILTQSGSQLLLYENRKNARKPRFNSSSDGAVDNSVDKSRTESAFLTLSEHGISATPNVRQIVRSNDYITPESIEAHAERLKQENRFSNGLLITVLHAGDPLPLSDAERRRRGWAKLVSD